MTWRAWIAMGGLALAPLGLAAPTQPFGQVNVPPAKTSIYLGSVTLTTSSFQREDGGYAAQYRAKVFPFSFYNERGTLRVEISDAQLDQLTRGQTIEFSGSAQNEHGEARSVTGRATPADAQSGKLKVRVAVTKRVELIFNTTYRFAE